MERERGIIVKAQTATMFLNHSTIGSDNIMAACSQKFLLNLIVTPGHVDFNYEVSSSVSSPLRMLLLDSYYDEYRRVCHVAIIDGANQKGKR